MSNNTTTSPAVSVGLTVYEQWLQYVLYVLLGFFGLVGNILIAVAIIKSKNLRSRFFIVVCTLVCVRATCGLQFVVMGLFRSLRTLAIASTLQKRISCHMLHIFIHVSYTVELCLLVVLVIDRMLAVVTPIFYKRLSRRQAKIVCIAIVVVVGLFAKLIPSLIGWDFDELVPCINAYSATSAWFNLYAQNQDLPIIVLVLLLYVVLWIVVKVRVHKWKNENSLEGRMQLERQTTVLPMLRNIVLTHSAVTLTSKFLVFLIDFVPEQALRLAAYSGNLNTIDLFLNVVVFLWSNKEIREAALPKCCLKKDIGSSNVIGMNSSMQVAPVACSNGIAGR